MSPFHPIRQNSSRTFLTLLSSFVMAVNTLCEDTVALTSQHQIVTASIVTCRWIFVPNLKWHGAILPMWKHKIAEHKVCNHFSGLVKTKSKEGEDLIYKHPVACCSSSVRRVNKESILATAASCFCYGLSQFIFISFSSNMNRYSFSSHNES